MAPDAGITECKALVAALAKARKPAGGESAPEAGGTATETTAPGDTGDGDKESTMAQTDQTAAFEAAVAKETERLARKAAKKAARESARNAGVSGEVAPAAPEAAPAETAEQRMARLSALAEAKVAEAAKAAGLSAEETDEQILDRLLEEKLVPLRQAAAESGGVNRKGIVAGAGNPDLLESIANGEAAGAKALREASPDDLARAASAAMPRRA